MYIVQWIDQSGEKRSRTFSTIDGARSFANSLRAGGASHVRVCVNDF